MRTTFLHTDLTIDECRKRLSAATSPMPGYWKRQLRKFTYSFSFVAGYHEWVVSKYNEHRFALAIERSGGFGFRALGNGIKYFLRCNVSKDDRGGTIIACRLGNESILWVIGHAATIFFILLVACMTIGFNPRLLLIPFFLSLICSLNMAAPLLLFGDDRPALIAFLKKNLNASEIE